MWVLSAGPAGASATFSPGLAPAAPSQTVASLSEVKAAPYTLSKSSRKRITRIVPVKSASSTVSGSELSRAKSLLAAQIRRHPILKGTTVSFGNAHGYQAIAFYSTGRIVISPTHRASLDRIIAHEVWHIIDWRDNHRIDWGENVPR